MEMHVGVIGLGTMGKTLTESLIAEEHAVAVWDRHPEKVATTGMIGASPSVSARQVAEVSDIVFLALPNADAVREVVLDPEVGVLAGLRAGSILIDMSTASPDLAVELSDAVTARGEGRRYVDAPV
ncbi:NAD(P)-dependent oxidoreductase [Cryobacterium glaciale]|uniref:NAD(P)-dependent oxidoreductase n=2 Tax=Cryobacterium glaciale TaxID=1259145 RepID=A0A4R8UUB9_9MICO|nr:NAD(P)-binding domain-containing protein [Cryobacterium glaciale]TFB72123.1 NAD(P)-dependent oxidoreductase [Cryobacterium glaciale]